MRNQVREDLAHDPFRQPLLRFQRLGVVERFVEEALGLAALCFNLRAEARQPLGIAAQFVEAADSGLLNALPSSYREKAESGSLARVVCDYIAGMTDHYVEDLRKKLIAGKKVEG